MCLSNVFDLWLLLMTRCYIRLRSGRGKPAFQKKSARYITVSSSSVIYSILVDRYRFGVFDEDLAASHLVLVDVHADRLQHMLDALSWVAVPPRPRLRRQDRVAE